MRDLPGIREKRRRNGSVYYQIRIHGRDVHLGTQVGAARRKATLLLMEAYGDDLQAGQPPRFVASLCERWEAEHPDYPKPWITRAWVAYAGHLALHELTPDHFDGYIARMRKGYCVQASEHGRGRQHTPERKADSFAANTIRDRIGHALRICRWAVDRGWLARAPRRPRLPAPTRQPRDVEPARLAEAFAELPARAANLLRFCLEAGCRPIEARLLRWDEVDAEARVVRIREHKTLRSTGRVRTLFLTDQAIQAIPERRSDSPWVFPSRLGGPYSASGLRSVLREATRRAAGQSSPSITPYQMRHTFAQHAADSGVDLADLAGLMGHADPRTTRFYMEVKSARLQRAAARLTSPLHGMPRNGPGDQAAGPSPSGREKTRPGKSAKVRRRPA